MHDDQVQLLIVDDEVKILDMLKMTFEMKECSVFTAENGVEALDILNSKKIDIVISDIKMPEMDGVELLRNIRRQFPMIRVIMITGYVTLENAMSCVKLGADDIIFKPIIDMETLEKTFDRSLETLKEWKIKLAKLRSMK